MADLIDRNHLLSIFHDKAFDKANTNVGDTISRQAAIGLIHSLYPSAPIMRMNRELWEKKYKPFIEAEKALEQLPSARLKGKWIQNENGTYSCSLCQSWIPEEQYHYARFCLYCGVEMENGGKI